MRAESITTSSVSGWLSWSALLRVCLVAGTYIIGNYALDKLGAFFSASEAIYIWYPAAALGVVLLLVGGLRYLPAIFLAPFFTTLLDSLFFSDTLFGFSVTLVLYAIAKVIGYGGVAYVLRHGVNIDPRLFRLRDVLWFVVLGALLAPFTVALLTVSSYLVGGFTTRADWFVGVLGFWAGDATGIGFLAPFLLVLSRAFPQLYARRSSFRKEDTVWQWPQLRLEHALQMLVLVITAWLAYGISDDIALNYDYLVFLPLIWIAARSRFIWSVFAVTLMNAVIAFWVSTRVIEVTVIELQLTLLTSTLLGVLLGGLFHENRHHQRLLQYSASHDVLTRLPNRAYFLEALEEAVHSETGHQVAVLFLDLDRFKSINDTYGHAAGDRLLIEVSQDLNRALRPDDIIARIGGDEFAILLQGIEVADDAVDIAERIYKTLSEPVTVQKQEIQVSSSVGISLSSNGFEHAEDLLRDADTAMHRAKAQGKATYMIFDAGMREQTLERLSLETDLQKALEAKSFEIHYQPILSLETGKIIGAEALLRWQHPERGFISPEIFIPLAEEAGLMVSLGSWVMEEVLKQACTWQTNSDIAPYVAVNLSTKQIAHPKLVASVRKLLEQTSFPAERFVLEVTENLIARDVERYIVTLQALADTGIRIAMDDFGTGYASLSYLKRLPIDILKIDRSFVLDLPDDNDDAVLVQAIVAMGKNLGLNVIAEGIETAFQEDFLKQQHCDAVQGFYYSKPVPEYTFRELLTASS